MSDITHLEYARKLDAEDELAGFRQEFVIADPELIYLDGNSLGRLPRATQRLLADLAARGWGERLIRGWNDGWMAAPERIGGKIAGLLGAQPDEVVVADSTSVNLFKLALTAVHAQSPRPKIISDDLNFPSDLYILEGVTQAAGRPLTIQIIPSPDGAHGPEADILAAIDEETALVTLSHTVFKSGWVYDMTAVTQRAHEMGAMVLWDLSHAAGSVPVDLHGSAADLAVGCTYKYLNGGPGAPAFLYVRRDLQQKLGNPLSGWMGQHNPFAFDLAYTPQPGIRRFLTGTPPILSLAAIEPGVDLLLAAGMDKIRAKSARQTAYLIALFDEWLAPLGFTLNTPRDPARRGSHVSIGHAEGWRIDQALIQEMNVLPDFRQPDNIRLGIAPLYTSYEEIWTAVARIRQVVTEKRYERYGRDAHIVT